MKSSDRIGTIVNNLKILDYKRESKRTYFYIECQICKKKKWLRADRVTDSRYKSCGCLATVSKFKRNDITDKKFGRLTAISPTSKRDENGSIIWRCKCECGNIKEVSVSDLTCGFVRSCGCLAKEVHHNHGINIGKETNKICLDGTNIRNLTMKKSKRNTSGIKGVSWDNRRQKWLAQIRFKGKVYYLGRYDDISAAAKARKIAEENIHGEFLKWYYDEYLKKKPLK